MLMIMVVRMMTAAGALKLPDRPSKIVLMLAAQPLSFSKEGRFCSAGESRCTNDRGLQQRLKTGKRRSNSSQPRS